ncbi:MAG: hypothetical protein FD154_1228 [Elusimicrobia bacterium]|nr:MAG: hypothetical protein FD154_1228 [Elusimicrobiota bacterium]
MDRLFLLPKNPSEMFACWQWTAAKIELFSSGFFAPEVTVAVLRQPGGEAIGEYRCRWDAQRLYVSVPAGGGSFLVELRADTAEGRRELLLTSEPASSPAGTAPCSPSSTSGEFYRKSV